MMDDAQTAFAAQYPQFGFDLDMMKVSCHTVASCTRWTRQKELWNVASHAVGDPGRVASHHFRFVMHATVGGPFERLGSGTTVRSSQRDERGSAIDAN